MDSLKLADAQSVLLELLELEWGERFCFKVLISVVGAGTSAPSTEEQIKFHEGQVALRTPS